MEVLTAAARLHCIFTSRDTVKQHDRVAQAPRPRCAMVKVTSRREDPVNELCLTVYKSLLLVHIGLTDVSCRRTYVHHLHCMLHSTDMSKNRNRAFFLSLHPDCKHGIGC